MQSSGRTIRFLSQHLSLKPIHMEADKREFCKTSRNVNSNGGSRVWKKVYKSDVTSDDMGACEKNMTLGRHIYRRKSVEKTDKKKNEEISEFHAMPHILSRSVSDLNLAYLERNNRNATVADEQMSNPPELEYLEINNRNATVADEQMSNPPDLEYLEIKNRNAIVADGQMSKPPDYFWGKEQGDMETSKFDQANLQEKHFGNNEVNTKALSRHDKTYRLENFEKNALIIFNQEYINGYMKPRLGTREDAEALTKTFGKFGFTTEVYNDLDRDGIFNTLKRFSEKDFTDYGCIAVAILTHGSEMGELRAKDRSFYEKDIINFFKQKENPTLVTKPKIIIIQACRGSKTTQAMHVMKHGNIITDHEDHGRMEHYTMPVESDILILHSTSAGRISYREQSSGSWFIQTLCHKINKLAETEDLEAIITEVKREIAIEKAHENYNRRTHQMDCNKQMPVVTSTLIRKLYLKKFGDDANETRHITDLGTANNANEKVYHPPLYSHSDNDDKPKLTPYIGMDTFEQVRNSMRLYVQDNPNDTMAQCLLDISEVLQKGPEFNGAKERISRAIKNHLDYKSLDQNR